MGSNNGRDLLTGRAGLLTLSIPEMAVRMPSTSYLTERIHDALAQSEGDPLRAKRLVLQWAGRDERLLRMLVGPHIRAIIADTVDRHAGKQARPRAAAPKRAKAPAKISLDSVVDRMGERFGGAVEPPRGMTALLHGAGSKEHHAGQRHADSLRTLAVAFARKRFDP